jgi:hypothetical protein
VTRRPGHLLVRSPAFLQHRPFTNTTEFKKSRKPYNLPPEGPLAYLFYHLSGKILYVNGRVEVYETNIADLQQVVFIPWGVEWDGQMWRLVLFRKLHKLEWVFG